jgi:hypothetical protein
LTIATMVEAGDWAVELPHPVLLHVGELLWIEGSTVCVRQRDGGVIVYEGSGFWLCR